MNYAVIPLAGTQFLVSEGDELQVNRVSEKEGETFGIIPLLVSEGKDLEIGMPEAENYTVQLKVLEHTKGEKLYVRRFKSKSRYRRKVGHRQPVSVVRVEKIVTEEERRALGRETSAGKTRPDESGRVEELPALENLDLSTRTKNTLKKAGIETVEELKKMTKEELLEIKGIGEKSAEEIISKLD